MFRILFFWWCFGFLWSQTPLCISNGVSLPTRDTLYVLVVFAEVDYSTGSCPGGFSDAGFADDWPTMGLPPRKEDLVDPVLYDVPKGVVTQFYHQASFGQYVILGDSWPERITVPCGEMYAGTFNVDAVFRRMKTPTASLSPEGIPWTRFDQWTITDQGRPCLKFPDGKADLVYVVWKNNRYLHGWKTNPNAGFGVTAYQSPAFAAWSGTNNISSFNNGYGSRQGIHTTVAEHLHGIFGGNHWHTAGGRGWHSTLAMGLNYGATAQLFSPMLSACGWDRWMMDWKPPGSSWSIGALDSLGRPIQTDFKAAQETGTTYLWVRDFLPSGDAIRIQLDLGNETLPSVKNQYIWLEYRRMEAPTDCWIDSNLTCARRTISHAPCGPAGLFAYYQLGKDQTCGNADIYSSKRELPNGLAGFLIPISAEGRFDMHYSFDQIQSPRFGHCQWGNASLPIRRDAFRPNPMTGQHDLWQVTDQNRDGRLYHGDTVQAGLSEWIGDSLVYNFWAGGDDLDAFSFSSGQTEFSLSTNPAPIPLYTLTTDFENKRVIWPPATYENREILLNGFRIRIVREGMAPDGQPGMLLRIDWQDWTIRESVRWCGQLRFESGKESKPLLLEVGKTIWLEKGESPISPAGIRGPDGTYDLSEPTVWQVKPGAVLHLKRKARIVIGREATLHLMKGATCILEKGAKIRVKRGGTFLSEGQILRP